LSIIADHTNRFVSFHCQKRLRDPQGWHLFQLISRLSALLKIRNCCKAEWCQSISTSHDSEFKKSGCWTIFQKLGLGIATSAASAKSGKSN